MPDASALLFDVNVSDAAISGDQAHNFDKPSLLSIAAVCEVDDEKSMTSRPWAMTNTACSAGR
ncbi:MAG: hypothetical protein MO846_01495 [Candidatus Devosia symbiotica]|nr:hypothetical protein [Candidatus Devosia symbiotica]